MPAPATAELLKGIPIRSSKIEAELTTPTGAAILASLVDDFGPLPAMKLSCIGYGAGHKDFPTQANLLRVMIGESIDTHVAHDAPSGADHHSHDHHSHATTIITATIITATTITATTMTMITDTKLSEALSFVIRAWV